MWLKVLCVAAIASGALGADPLLESLWGRHGRNRAAVCVLPRGRRCAAALLTREWLVARARCVSGAASASLAAERLAAPAACDRVAAGITSPNHRNVRSHVMHPFLDLAMIIVDHPYNNLDQLPNATTIRRKLRRHGVYKWMKYYFDAYALTRNHRYHLHRMASNMKTSKYPIWFFFMTIVMPSVLFMLCFMYVIFYTGSPQKVPNRL